MESNDKEKASCVSILKSLIAPEKGGMQMHQLERIYLEEIGSRIPYAKFGFKSLIAFLTSIPEIHLDHMQLLHVRDPKMAHITAMVEAQRSNKKRPARNKRPVFQSGGRATGRTGFSSGYSFPTRKPNYSVSQSKKAPARSYNAVPSLLNKMPTVEYVNGVPIHKPPYSVASNKPSTVVYKKPTPSSPKKSSVPMKPSSPNKAVYGTVDTTPTRKTTIEYVNGIATTYIDGIEVKKAPIYNNPNFAGKSATDCHNGVGVIDEAEKSKADECYGYNGELSLEVNGRRRMITRPAHLRARESDMRDIEEGLNKTKLNDDNGYITIEQQELMNGRQYKGNEMSNNWSKRSSTSTNVRPDYSCGDSSAIGGDSGYDDRTCSAKTYTPSPGEHRDDWNLPNNLPVEAQRQKQEYPYQQYKSDGSHDQHEEQNTRHQEDAACAQPTPVQSRLLKAHQRLKAINRHKDRTEVVPDPPHRSVVMQGGSGLLTVSLDNTSCRPEDVALPPPPSDLQTEYEDDSKWKVDSMKLTLRPIFCGHQLIGDNFFLGLAKSPEINAQITALGGEDFRCGLCVSGLSMIECHSQVLNARVMANKVVLMMGAMDILTNKSFTELKIQAIGLMEILLEKTKLTSIVLCTIPPLLTATEKQRLCQLEFNKWLKTMVLGSRLFSCCDLFSKFFTLEDAMPVNDRLYAREPTIIDVGDKVVRVFLWNKDGCSVVLQEVKKALH